MIDTERLRGLEMERFRINLLCMIGAAVGISAIFIPWFNAYDGDVTILTVIADNHPIEYGFGIYQSVACMVFVAGAMMAFLTQAGAYLEAAGAVAFMLAEDHYLALVDIGFFVALISVGVMVVSQIVLLEVSYPFRVEHRRSSIPMRDRFYSYRPRADYPGDISVSLRLAGFAIAAISLQLALVEEWSANIPSAGAGIQRVTEFAYDLSAIFMAVEVLFNKAILLWLGLYAFVGGTALALTTSRAGIIQLLGSLLILGGVYVGNPYGLEGTPSLDGYPSNVVYDIGQGFYVGLLGAAVTCVSLAYSVVTRRLEGRRVRRTDLFFAPGG